MPNIVKLRADLEEDPLLVKAIAIAAFTPLSYNLAYMILWMEEKFKDMAAAVEWGAAVVNNVGWGLELDTANMIPSEEWRNAIRKADRPLFEDEYKPGWPGGPYDFIKGANSTVVAGFVLLVLYLGGRNLLLLLRPNGFMATAAMKLSAYQNTAATKRMLRDTHEGVESLMTTDADLMAMLMSETGKSSLAFEELQTSLKLLTAALDSNKSQDVEVLNDWISNRTIAPEPGPFSDL